MQFIQYKTVPLKLYQLTFYSMFTVTNNYSNSGECWMYNSFSRWTDTLGISTSALCTFVWKQLSKLTGISYKNILNVEMSENYINSIPLSSGL